MTSGTPIAGAYVFHPWVRNRIDDVAVVPRVDRRQGRDERERRIDVSRDTGLDTRSGRFRA